MPNPAGPSLVMNSKGGAGSAAPTLKTGAVLATRGWRSPAPDGGDAVMAPFTRRVEKTVEPDIIAHEVCTSGAPGATDYALAAPAHAQNRGFEVRRFVPKCGAL